MLWHHLLTRDVIESCETTVRYGWEVDALLDATGGPGGRLHVAEVISRSAAARGLSLPVDDAVLLSTLAPYAIPPEQWSGGTILAAPGRRVAYALGDGRTVESTGHSLTILQNMGERYTTGYRVPTLTHH